ncbi:MAG: hypothetical protein PHF67_03235 [Candidatus Nanoarchaeia archaeon]|nr:hypothetical protein [Candidatus Nanoarchaeia archaeon]
MILKLKGCKRGIELDMLAWWIIGIIVLVIGVLAYLIFTGKLTGGVDFIKNLFRFGAG